VGLDGFEGRMSFADIDRCQIRQETKRPHI
jgi:hypothetical protein